MTCSEKPRLRIGAVAYLNAKPLIEGLSESHPCYELVLDYPSRLAESLAAGQLDVGLIPSVECSRNADCRIVSDACVACFGPARSVKLYSRVPPEQIRSLALDDGSRTSAALAIILLAERYGVRPRTEPLPCDRSTEATDADAILLIGDRAFQTPSEPFAETWDLGDEWSRWTGLPFVFALWAARPEAPFEELSRLLQQSRDQGTERLSQIARREASALGIPLSVATEYLTENLHYRLGNSEREGLSVFRNLAARHGLIPKGVDLVFAESLA